MATRDVTRSHPTAAAGFEAVLAALAAIADTGARPEHFAAAFRGAIATMEEEAPAAAAAGASALDHAALPSVLDPRTLAAHYDVNARDAAARAREDARQSWKACKPLQLAYRALIAVETTAQGFDRLDRSDEAFAILRIVDTMAGALREA